MNMAQAQRHPQHVLLCIAALVFPAIGVAAGIYGLSRPDLPQTTARGMVICGVINALGIAAIVWIVIALPWIGLGMITTAVGSRMAGPAPKDVSVQVLSWYPTATVGSGMFVYQADPGNQYAVMTVKVTNNSKERALITDDEIELTCDNQAVYAPASLLDVSGVNSLSADLLPGGTANGQVTFEIPATAKPLSVAYRPRF